ncbi:hypothetical protein I316_06555 [Kwoniella heveanensis BCC8398]|uniref:Integral membrane bound transporter domain-containing protein n=1 Tax=Kwoniella heveanensis BCC8398 TaxID=1296120 RepID=A0A1B9GL84_9TREE|nr:hypothetical protein I316_06555 [Kwoniella heveanensis BCC8398]
MDWVSRLRLLAIPTLMAFLSFVFVVIKPWSKIAGQWAFLVYTSNLIFFFPRGHVAAQAEATVLGLLGGTIGIAWSTATLSVAAYCGRTYGPDSDQSRAILGLGLALLSLAAGFVRSYSRRLQAFSKISLFFPIFMLTSQQAITNVTAAHFLEQFYVLVFSAVFALLPTLLLAPRQSSNQLGIQINESVQTVCALLPLSISSLLDVDGHMNKHGRSESANPNMKALEAQSDPLPPPNQDQLAKQLKAAVSSLHISKTWYIKDSRLMDHQSTSLLAVIKSLQRLQRNPLMGQTSHAPGDRIRAALQKSFPQPSSRPSSVGSGPKKRRSFSLQRHHRKSFSTPDTEMSPVGESPLRPKHRHLTSNFGRPNDSHRTIPLASRPDLKDASQHLVKAVVEALGLVNVQLARKFRWPSPVDRAEEKEGTLREELFDARVKLEDVLNEVQRALGTLLSGSETPNEAEGERRSDSSETPLAAGQIGHVGFSESTDVTSLLRNKDRFRLAFYMTALLDLAKDVHGITDTVIEASSKDMSAFSWLAFFRLGWMRHDENEDDEEQEGHETELVAEEEQPHDQMKEYQDMDFVTAHLYKSRPSSSSPGDRFARAWRMIWDRPKVIKSRVMISRTTHRVKHSRHVMFAFKLALGISLLSIPALLSPGQAGRNWYETSRGGWMVVSYMFVLEDTTGAILKIGFLRGLGCLIGAVTGYVCALIAHENPYALVTLATATSVPISWHILFNKTTPALGVQTGITLPPLLFITYLGYANGQSDFELAWYRFTEIIIGTAAAVLFGTSVWPVHARVQYFRAVSGTMERITEFYLRMSRDLVRSSLVYRVDDKQYDTLEAKIKRDLALSRTLIAIQRQEISLLPRPVRLYSEIIDASERLLETLVEIRMLRFSVPRKATVLDVLPIRRELISTILINLWACGHAFHSRSPLPQFLPSPRSPLSELMEVTDEHARDIRAFRNTYVDGEGKSRERGRALGGTAMERERSASPAISGTSSATYQAEMAILYAMAENEALGEVCNILEEIVAAAKTLFGSQSFLDPT